MAIDARVCFVGDSLTAGVGDAGQRGWVGRVAEGFRPPDVALTHYNLGVRTDTSVEVLARWRSEVRARLAPHAVNALVVSFGVNDAREPFAQTHPVSLAVDNLQRLLDDAARAGLPTMVVGLLPVADPAHNHRSAAYDRAFRDACAARHVPFVEVLEPMLHDPTWMREIPRGDGLHPGPGGYQALAKRIGPAWSAWLAGLAAHAAETGEDR